MIKHLSIKDFAIIDNISVDFHEGLNILTGETGAGKSIIIEAVSLALGSRADTAFVRSGKEKSIIQLIVSDNNDDESIITREVFSSGKSTCKIDDVLVTLSHLNAVCKEIADIHGQYDHQSLLNSDQHIQLVDSYDSALILPLKEQLKTKFKAYDDIKRQLSTLTRNQLEASRKMDFMRFESQEILSAKLSPCEDEELTGRLLLLQNSEKIVANLSATYDLLYSDEHSSLSGLIKGANYLKEVSSFSTGIAQFEAEILDSYYKLEDVCHDIKKYLDQISFSPIEIDETIKRLELIDGFKRKYGSTIEKILDYEKAISQQLEEIEHSDELKEKLQRELTLYQDELTGLSHELSKHRCASAEIIEKKINKELLELNFNHAALVVQCQNLKDVDGNPLLTDNGYDHIEFLITTNKGEVPKPLVKIASGGEISRIMLAFKRIIGDYDLIPTMIFDEIDSGISGATASIVGKKLAEISKNHQVICITHLPQIAAAGDYNYKIDKKTTDQHTFTVISPLDDDSKIKEIARLLGGMTITSHTLKNAEELINLAKF